MPMTRQQASAVADALFQLQVWTLERVAELEDDVTYIDLVVDGHARTVLLRAGQVVMVL